MPKRAKKKSKGRNTGGTSKKMRNRKLIEESDET